MCQAATCQQAKWEPTCTYNCTVYLIRCYRYIDYKVLANTHIYWFYYYSIIIIAIFYVHARCFSFDQCYHKLKAVGLRTKVCIK